MPPKKPKISDFRPQQNNANQHTQRGLGMLDESISQHGWIGAISCAADGEVFDGSARLETVYTRFGEDVEPIVVETDGSRPVVVKRTDIPDAEDPRAKMLALAANRIAEIDLSWSPEVLAELSQDLDLSGLFRDDELTKILGQSDFSVDHDAPSDFKEYDEQIETEHCCPKCGYKWSGGK